MLTLHKNLCIVSMKSSPLQLKISVHLKTICKNRHKFPTAKLIREQEFHLTTTNICDDATCKHIALALALESNRDGKFNKILWKCHFLEEAD